MSDPDRRFIYEALPSLSRAGRGAAEQRKRTFRDLNETLAGPSLKYMDLENRIGRERAVELYIRGLVEHGVRPFSVAGTPEPVDELN